MMVRMHKQEALEIAERYEHQRTLLAAEIVRRRRQHEQSLLEARALGIQSLAANVGGSGSAEDALARHGSTPMLAGVQQRVSALKLAPTHSSAGELALLPRF